MLRYRSCHRCSGPLYAKGLHVLLQHPCDETKNTRFREDCSLGAT